LNTDPAFPTLGSNTTVTSSANVESEWGHSIVKKKPPVENIPVVQESTTKSTSTKPKISQPITTASPSFQQEESFPEMGKAQEQGGKKGQKGKKEKYEKKETPQETGGKSDKPSAGPTLFQQVYENLSTRSNTSYGREETKISYEYDEEGVGNQDHFEEYEKYMKEGYNEDEVYDYDEGGYYEEEMGYEESEAELNNYLKQHQTDRGGGGLVLMVAEKPSIAKSITEALSGGKSKMRKGKFFII